MQNRSDNNRSDIYKSSDICKDIVNLTLDILIISTFYPFVFLILLLSFLSRLCCTVGVSLSPLRYQR
jgi:hypothetical protein